MSIEARMNDRGPKKILTLDGGGIRGLISISILTRIEAMLKEETNDPDLVLADYFDFVSGTSTGAIIAAGIARGMSMKEIQQLYVENGRMMFTSAGPLKRIFGVLYKSKPLETMFRRVFQEEDGTDMLLGSPRLRTLLMMVMRNASTDSPWPVSNNPNAKYNDMGRADCNLKIPLWKLLRASTAAPVFFRPEKIRMGSKSFLFVDGGITCYNNPSFQSVVMATAEPYRLNWQPGEDRLLVVSVGTGAAPQGNISLKTGDMHWLYNIKRLPAFLMGAASAEQDLLCRVFGKCTFGAPIDREVGDMISNNRANGPVSPKLFTYLRYNAELTRKGLRKLGLHKINPRDVQRLDAADHMEELLEIGRRASKSVDPKDFKPFLESHKK